VWLEISEKDKIYDSIAKALQWKLICKTWCTQFWNSEGQYISWYNSNK
jgi:hypothetical protein